ncbi:MAG TPA: diguanylate cyclase [Methylibium sp.]|uniref:GGDEF domain-containing protein n=1 Tax=Methylibium sp. TaxID=2067992 RepID=UPI002DBD5850|nr:diguanylate cyclase [Methylibium sp.]HEU4458209.1 diguanylate cyclase [Methylibium sp.]
MEAAAAPETAGADTSGDAWAKLIERAVRGLERGSKQWTTARRKDSLFRVLGGSRSDARRLHHRLTQLVASWDGEARDEPVTDLAALDEAVPPVPAAVRTAPIEIAPPAPPSTPAPPTAWPDVAASFGATVQVALPRSEPRGREVADKLAALQSRLAAEGPQPHAEAIAAACDEARRVLQHRHHLLAQLGGLARELTASLADLAEDDSWVRGQAEVMRRELLEGDAAFSARGVRSVGELLRTTRERQRTLRSERAEARIALKASIQQMLGEIAALGAQTGRFSERLGRHAAAIESADSLDTLADTVRELVAESRAVHEDVSRSQQRLANEQLKADAMQQRVAALEDEIRRLSSEVSTDPLTQIANRRGLLAAFEAERGKRQRAVHAGGTPAPGNEGEAAVLSVALIDLDNFKKLNDRLGHANGDEALKFLSRRVQLTLRPGDTLARYGGEEFVVLLPATPVDEAQRVLTRVQRSLSAELFMSDAEGQVFVTFSAGVTAWRGEEETLVQALERADEALYEAKRTGKNRTCIG